jgi:putative spermidine/putrescine transport system ATP-binding protein
METRSAPTMQHSTQQLDVVVGLTNLRKEYGEFVAVDSLSLEVRRGELLCLLGPSGCGKTTTLRMIAGFIEPTGGSIRIEGNEVSQLPPYRRDTGMVFQNYALFPHMNVSQNVAFGLENIGMSSNGRQKRVSEMLEMVELSQLARRYPKELSGGQQQRVALARALALHPAVLLLDEPFSNLDAQLRVRLRQQMQRVLKKMNITTLFVTHDQEEALMLSDRVVVMNKGKVEQVGAPEEIYERPVNRFVAEFIGSCNVFEGEVANGMFRSEGGLAVPVSAGASGRRTLIIRPEYLEPATGTLRGLELEGTVETVAYFGSLSRITIQVGAEKVMLDAQHQMAGRPRPGDHIRVAVHPDGVRLL